MGKGWVLLLIQTMKDMFVTVMNETTLKTTDFKNNTKGPTGKYSKRR